MSKVTMPEPIGFITDESYCAIKTGKTNCKGAVPIHQKESRVAKTPLFTDDQLESYADARVREALDEAAKVCDTYFKEIEEQSRSTYQEGAMDAADILEQRIRALFPSTPA